MFRHQKHLVRFREIKSLCSLLPAPVNETLNEAAVPPLQSGVHLTCYVPQPQHGVQNMTSFFNYFSLISSNLKLDFKVSFVSV